MRLEGKKLEWRTERCDRARRFQSREKEKIVSKKKCVMRARGDG